MAHFHDRALAAFLDERRNAMIDHVLSWSLVNSGSAHLEGLERMQALLVDAWSDLAVVRPIALGESAAVNDQGAKIAVRHGAAIEAVIRPEAATQIVLTGHFDTVYGKDHAFQTPRRHEDGRITGPGVADMKGGLIVMLEAIRAYEAIVGRKNLGFRVLLSPDEEVGSPASAPELARIAQGAALSLTFEPALPDGQLAGARKGSGNFTAIARGRAAHAGRNPHDGRNALVLCAQAALALSELGTRRDGLTVNPAKIVGGGPVNTVPDFALLRFNARAATKEDEAFFLAALAALKADFTAREGFDFDVVGGFSRPPKPMDDRQRPLFDAFAATGRDVGINVSFVPTGGVCEGNNLAAAGLRAIDSLGVVGGFLHSPDEYMMEDSLTERALLTAAFLARLAQGRFPELAPEAPR